MNYPQRITSLTAVTLLAVGSSYAATTNWTIPGAASGLTEWESNDVQADQSAYSFHGIGGGGADLAGGFQTQNVSNSGAATMLDASAPLSFAVGDTINMQLAAGSWQL